MNLNNGVVVVKNFFHKSFDNFPFTSLKKRNFSSFIKTNISEFYKNEKNYKSMKKKRFSVFSEKDAFNNFSLIFNKEKKKILSTEEIILEEYRKNKFKATPLNKRIFSCVNKKNKFDEKYENNKKNYKSVVKQNKNFSRLNSNKSLSSISVNTSRNISINKNKTDKPIKKQQKKYYNKITTLQNEFIARPLPSFNYKEVIKSKNPLTNPESPYLETKIRALQKEDKIKKVKSFTFNEH